MIMLFLLAAQRDALTDTSKRRTRDSLKDQVEESTFVSLVVLKIRTRLLVIKMVQLLAKLASS